RKKNCYDTEQQTITTRMYKKLDKIPSLLTANEVLIENQPSMNPPMKSIASFLFGYFSMRGIVDREDSDMKVKFFAASNKLKLSTEEAELIISTMQPTDKIYKIALSLITTHWSITPEILKTYEKDLVSL